MFLRRYSRTKNGKKYTYFALVQSVRTEAGPRQRIVAHLGELSHYQERRWQRTTTFFNRHGDEQQLQLFPDDENIPLPDDPRVVRVRLDSVGWTNARNFGDIALAHWLWTMLELDQIVDRHIPQNKETVRPADIVAIEVINRLCAPCSEFALAEHWYRSTALDDLLGVPDEVITKDRLYRTLDRLRAAKTAIEDDLKNRLGTLFQLDYNLLLYDLTSSYFEGLAENNDLARRGYSRDHRGDCKQIVLALVVTPEGFPLAHHTLVGNTQDVTTVCRIIEEIETRFGKSQRVWVMDRGMISEKTLAYFNQDDRLYVLATRRTVLKSFMAELRAPGWQTLPANPEVRIKLLERDAVYYLLARSRERRRKERAIRLRQRQKMKRDLRKLLQRVEKGRLRQRDKIIETIGRIKSRYPKAQPFYAIAVGVDGKVTVGCHQEMFRDALLRDGAYLLQSNRAGWTPQEFWETYMQLTVVEKAFRVLKSELLIRPIWHQYSGRTEAHVFVCVLAYALWKTLDHLLKKAGLQTLIHKEDEERADQGVAKPRPMTPEACLRELQRIMVGDILLETTDGRNLALRRVARPNTEQQRILAGLGLELPERLSADRQL